MTLIKDLEDELHRLERRAQTLESRLIRWKGMTLSEAEKAGWTDKEQALQNELWVLGYRISGLKARVNRVKG